MTGLNVDHHHILKPNYNCCLEDASRFSVIVDAAEYFSAFAEACRAARR